MSREQAKKKKQNWTKEEKETLLHEVDQRRSILFAKFSIAITNVTKRREWSILTEKLNAVNTEQQRTLTEVKKKWQDSVSLAKKNECQRRKLLKQTGGGEKPPDLSSTDEKIIQIYGNVAVEGITGGRDTASVNTAEVEVTNTLDESDGGNQQTLSRKEDKNRSSNSSSDGPENTDPPTNFAYSANEQSTETPRPSTSSTEKNLKRKTEVEHPLVEIERQRLKVDKEILEVQKCLLQVEKERLKIEKERLEVEKQNVRDEKI
ncbi:LOW QUALITY PROTEIN: myb/SANT-like DNA-binding domain-containing protein 4 [Gigantopelta aegis]|uniref:LOW QUALITY PROTEIN: myb/SANT-like DNA-binding domain-containing protein 4 n=1 Tax=Gigantopelta aegis TaxID=1735272 RepID=UPI001B8893F3|nr:LOW QUALITY PROTEIN: myb/SANT-like DNA-binding domain-containing protein 4 [Gigantopelta aegis]